MFTLSKVPEHRSRKDHALEMRFQAAQVAGICHSGMVRNIYIAGAHLLYISSMEYSGRKSKYSSETVYIYIYPWRRTQNGKWRFHMAVLQVRQQARVAGGTAVSTGAASQRHGIPSVPGIHYAHLLVAAGRQQKTCRREVIPTQRCI